MSKNLTRKGIAFGAMVALGTSLFAGAPANAADEVTLAVSAGTGNATILGETFTLKASLGSLVPSSSNGTLKFAVTNASSAALTYTPTAAAGTRDIQVDDVDSDATSGVSTGASDVVWDAQGTPLSVHTLGISTTATTATSVSVIAFLDRDGEDDLDTTEFQSAPITVNFVKAADAGISTAWSAQLGDASAKAVVTSSVVNVAQIADGHIVVQFGQYVNGTKTDITGSGTYGTLTVAGAGGISAALNTTTKASHDATDSSAINLTAGSYVAQALWNKGSGDFVKVGSEVAFGLAAAEAVAATGKTEYEVVASENVTSLGVVRATYTGDITYKVTVRDTDKKVLAGKIVRLTSGTITSGTFKVNGVTAASTTAYNATTDAAGVATFVVSSSTAVAGNTFVAGAITVEGVEIASAANSIDLAWTAASYTAVEKANFDSSDFKRGVDGTSAALEFVIVDQWKKVLTSADYRIKATLSDRTVSVVTDTFADGAASFTITDGALSTGQTTVALALEQLSSGTWAAASTITVPAITNRVFYWYSQTDKVTLNADAASGADLAATYAVERTVAVDTRLSNTDKTVFGTSSPDEQVTITGTVANSTTLAAKQGAKVTVSGDASILFNVGDTYAFGSLTFYDADGALVINAYSNKAQTDSVVTVTSNGVAKTVKISFTGPTAASVVSAINASAPAYAVPGSAVRVKFTAVDKYGNTVKLTSTADENLVTLVQTGAGYLVSTPATFVDGVVELTLITAPADSGVVTVKATATLGASDSLSATASLTLGAAPVVAPTVVVAISGSTGKVYVSVTNAAGKKVVVKVSAKFAKSFTGTLAKKSVAVLAAKGSKKITVYVGGKLVATKTVTIK